EPPAVRRPAAAGYNSTTGNHDKRLVIKPYIEANAKAFGVCNSLSSMEDGRGASRDRIDGNPGQALGGGSSVLIRFDPIERAPGRKCPPPPGQPASGTDDTLMHEMLHGLRQMVGQWDGSSIGLDYDTIEEFYAILLTNIYMSERGKPQLRKNHHGKVPLEPEYCTSEGFLQRGDHLRWVNWLVTHNAVFLKKVADVDAPFNPIRKYLGDPGAYSTLLQMATATKTKP